MENIDFKFMGKVLLLITTEADEKKAKKIAELLIQKKLAACVSIKQIFSIYKWGDDIEQAKEFEIVIKSKPELKNELIIFIKEISSYDVPQILFKKFEPEKEYGNWLTKTI